MGMFSQVNDFDQSCLKHLTILLNAETAANKMTTHKEADVEVAGLKDRYNKVKAVSDEWMKKAEAWSRNGNSLITPSTNSIPGWPRTVVQNKNRTSLWKRWSLLWESSKTSSRRRRGLSITCKKTPRRCFLYPRSRHHCQLLFYNKNHDGTVTQEI